ncbi:hypothetical protein SAMN05216593_1159 [Pseudomonas asturiensis]|uniref:Imm33-like domain-containing protein n=1 Tax=Pseudomonas asturiensis TaxID=1190415 RepID=A0A1M7PXQ1_9PSED|nr:hypothetical protein [Pseudomonas asturiensis]SHN22481.1 hypothetical protein SAMN05216593_1159 [Pseudomonas asturiensis]
MKIKTSINDSGLLLNTEGLLQHYGYEITVQIHDDDLEEHAIAFIETVANYLDTGHEISSNETLGYGSWVTKMQLNDCKELIFFEQVPLTGDCVLGITTTLTMWAEQHAMCAKAGVEYSVPRHDQLIVISDGVLEGDPAEGVRYSSPEHMSGWWITTDRYNGDTKTLKTVHAHHVAEHRPDLVKFLALPFGYRFYGITGEAWRDKS